MASGAALLLHPQNNIYCFLFFTEFTNTQSQSEDYEEVRHLLGMRWFLSFFSLRSKILWFLNLLFLLGPTFWNKASPTSGHRHPKEIFLTHTHTHTNTDLAISTVPRTQNYHLSLIFYLHIWNPNNLYYALWCISVVCSLFCCYLGWRAARAINTTVTLASSIKPQP